VTHIDGHVPMVTELVEFVVAQAFMTITDFADLIVVCIDNFQWVDSFTWKVTYPCTWTERQENVANLRYLCAIYVIARQASALTNPDSSELPLGYHPGALGLARKLKNFLASWGMMKVLLTSNFAPIYTKGQVGVPVYVIELLELIKRRNSVSQNGRGNALFNE
jgi:hypothetical protein